MAIEQMWDLTNISKIDLSDLSETEKDSAIQMLNEHPNMIATSYSDLGCCTIGEHIIQINADQPIFTHPYRKTMRERENISR